MSDLVNAFKSTALKTAEFFTPVLKESKFRETGVITPEEFVIAGDHLVHQCPTWFWSSGDESQKKPYLPPDKQYLCTRRVPCYKRCKEIEYSNEHEQIIDEDSEDGGWVDTHANSVVEQIQEMKIGGDDNTSTSTALASAEEDDDEEAADMDDFMNTHLEEDPATVDIKAMLSTHTSATDPTGNKDSGILATRTYDLHIAYDNYYRTPRLFLSGFTENNEPLNTDLLFEDISQDHAKKTVTVEAHPHLANISMASVHPCRHAEVMKKIIQTMEENGRQLEVYQYLIVFLKFVQAVIPTIEYDYTQNFSM